MSGRLSDLPEFPVHRELVNTLFETDQSLYRIRYTFKGGYREHERVDNIVGHLAYFSPGDTILEVRKIR